MVVTWNQLLLIALLAWMPGGLYLAILKKITGNVWVAGMVAIVTIYWFIQPPDPF